MSTETEKLKLFKWDTTNQSDLDSNFDIDKTLNGNWDKIEKNAKEIDSKLSELENNKVSKIDGKKLSTNDFTNEYKDKLDDLNNYNDTEIKNDINENTEKITQNTKSIQTNRTDINKILSEYITKAVNDLQNYYLKEEIDEKISSIPKFSIEVVETLPTENISTTTIYLVLTGEETDNIYTEYIYTDKWEKLGTQKIDLTNYYTISQITELLKKKANTESIPTKTSDLENDSKFIKETELNESQQIQDTKIQKLLDETEELIEQMPWSTTEKAESISVEDSAKYSRNRLNIFGNLYQKTRKGYNLIDTSSFTDRTVNGMTFTRKDDGTILINGTSTNRISFQVPVNFIIPAGDYTLYVPYTEQLLKMTIALGNDVQITGTDIQPTSKTGANAYCKQITFAEDKNVNQLRFYLESASTATNYVLKWMLIKGKYTADTIPEYEQYGVMPSRSYPSIPVVATGLQTVNVAHNILPLDVDEWENGTIDGSDGTPKNNNSRIRMKDYKTIESKTRYVASLTNNVKVLAIRFYDSDYNFIKYDYNFISEVVVPATAKYYKCILKNENDTAINNTYIKKAKVILYKEKDVKEIELDLGDTELCKITDDSGNVVAQDRSVYRKVDEVWKWQWEKYIKKRVFNGTEDWQTASAYEGFYRYSLNLNEDGLTDSATKNTYGLNTHFTQRIEQSYGGYEYLLIQINSTKGTAYIQTKDLATLADFKAWLSQNNVIVYYVTKVEYEDCTEEQSEQLNELYNLYLQKGVNNIINENESGIGCEMQLEYMQDRNIKYDNDISELRQAIVALGGVV